MKAFIFKTDHSYAALVQRILLGIVLFPHGAQKLLGWFGGYGFSNSMAYFTQNQHLPWLIGFLIILLEFIGSLLLIAGFATRLIGIAFTLLALGIILTTRLEYGFFMNWFNLQKGEGYEFFILMIALSISLTISGGGKASADGLIGRK